MLRKSHSMQLMADEKVTAYLYLPKNTSSLTRP